ncbi:MAG TPA: HtaA domain-containing protein [Solirubrobacterales bacterium]
MNKQFAKYIGTFGIKVSPIGKTKIKGSKATFKVTGGSFDPTSGKGTLTHSGGLTFKAGKKKAQLKALEVNTSKKTVTGRLGGKKVVVAKTAGVSFSRNGFGVNLVVKKVKLTPAAANALNKALGFAGGKPLPFQKNKLIGSSKSSEQPKTTTLVPGGSMTLALNSELATKLSNVKANIQTLTGTTVLGNNTFSFPITGGTFAPNGTAGTVQSGGGLSLVQNLSIAGKSLDTNITLGGVWYDLQAKTLTVEVSATSTASKDLNLGSLGRSSVADVTIGGVIADPKTRSVAVQNSSAVLQQVSGEVLNGFVKVYAEYAKGSKELEALKSKEEAEKLGAEAIQLKTEAEKDKKEAEDLAGEGKFAEAGVKQAEAEAKGKEAAEKGKAAEDKKAEAEKKVAEGQPTKEQVEKDNAIAGGQQLGLVSFSGQAQ